MQIMLETYQRVYFSRKHKTILYVHHVSFSSPSGMPDKLTHSSYSLCLLPRDSLYQISAIICHFPYYMLFSLISTSLHSVWWLLIHSRDWSLCLIVSVKLPAALVPTCGVRFTFEVCSPLSTCLSVLSWLYKVQNKFLWTVFLSWSFKQFALIPTLTSCYYCSYSWFFWGQVGIFLYEWVCFFE